MQYANKEAHNLFARIDLTPLNASAACYFATPFEHTLAVDFFAYNFVIVSSITAQKITAINGS